VTPLSSQAGPVSELVSLGPKWTGERADFIREQYLTHRKSAGEIALMLGPAFTRNAVTGKLYRMGALQARSGTTLGKTHGLPRVNHFCPGPKPKGTVEKKTGIRECERTGVPARPAASRPAEEQLEGPAFVRRTEKLFDIPGIPLLDAQKGQCRWPARTENGIAHVCGAPSSRGAYCAHHAVIAYRLKPISRSRRSKICSPGSTPINALGPA
jgi:GcrA cell cycle regulator